MKITDIAQYVFFLLVVTLAVKPLGGYLAHVFAGERTLFDFALRPVERIIHREHLVMQR